MLSGGKGPRSTAASASSSWASSVMPSTRLDRSRLPSVNRKATCAGVPWLAPSAARTAGGAAHLVVEIGAGGHHGEPLGPPRARQRAAGPDPDGQHAHVQAPAGRHDAAEFLAPPVRRGARPGGARIDRIVIDLGGVEAAAVDHLQAGLRAADRAYSAGLDEPLLLEQVEGVGDGAQDLAGRERRTVADPGPDLIVEL